MLAFLLLAWLGWLQAPAAQSSPGAGLQEVQVEATVSSPADDPEEELRRRRALLLQILSQETEAASPLPPLIAQQDSGWLTDFLENLRALLRDFLESLFPDRQPFFGSLPLGPLLRYVIYGVVICLVAWGAYRGLKAWLAPAAAELGQLPEQSRQDPVARLKVAIQAALERGEYQRAARLRWKLFLQRASLSLDVTPGEFLIASSTPVGPDPSFNQSATQQYNRLMFAGQPAEAAQFQEMDRVLFLLERRRDFGKAGEENV